MAIFHNHNHSTTAKQVRDERSKQNNFIPTCVV